MKLLVNEEFDITEYCGRLVVTYLSRDRSAVKELFDLLDDEGYHYHKNEIGIHSVIKNSYVSDMQTVLDECSCYVLYLTDSFQEEKNRALRNIIWYQIGILEARRSGMIIPIVPKNKEALINGTPIQALNAISSFEEIKNALNDKTYVSLVRNQFYSEDSLNIYSKDRIEYRRMVVKFNIPKENFDDALEAFNRRSGNEVTADEFLNEILRCNITCGIYMISFGSETIDTPHHEPYREEMHITEGITYPQNFKCKVWIKAPKNSDVPEDGELLCEYILPTHCIFGLNFKAFVQATGKLKVSVLKKLLESDFTEDNDVTQNDKKLYFSLNFPRVRPFVVDERLNIGRKADYVYPK